MLADWGWDGATTPGLARVTGQERDRWVVQTDDGPAIARLVSAGEHPVTGDWIVTEPGPSPTDPLTIVALLPRRTAVLRGRAGDGAAEQVLAANVDVIWIVHGLDAAPNLRGIERYLVTVWESGAVPEIVLTKADLSPSVASAIADVEAIAVGARIHTVSVQTATSLELLRAQLQPGRTIALLGPSGAGKSTLINALAGEELAATGEVRAHDRRGRHTTTRRELFQLPGGALLMDTPGLRELRVWATDEGLAHIFPEIADLATGCRFRDCQHEAEPGCAVLAAVAAGQLDTDRLLSYRKLLAETAYLERREDPRAEAAAVARHKTALKTLKYHPKYRRD